VTDVGIEVRCWAVAEDMDKNFHGEARYESTLVHPLAKAQDQSFGVRKLTVKRVASLRVPNVGCVRLNRDVLPDTGSDQVRATRLTNERKAYLGYFDTTGIIHNAMTALIDE
jgi:hypothetical protein